MNAFRNTVIPSSASRLICMSLNKYQANPKPISVRNWQDAMNTKKPCLFIFLGKKHNSNGSGIKRREIKINRYANNWLVGIENPMWGSRHLAELWSPQAFQNCVRKRKLLSAKHPSESQSHEVGISCKPLPTRVLNMVHFRKQLL